MSRSARPEQLGLSGDAPECEPATNCSEPIYLRHRFQGELGRKLREYYADAVEQPLPDRLLQLIEQFRQKEQTDD